MLFIDNIRWTMILLVLSMHATDTYSPFGNWYYTDRSQTTLTTALIFGSYQSILQAFFMALLFFSLRRCCWPHPARSMIGVPGEAFRLSRSEIGRL